MVKLYGRCAGNIVDPMARKPVRQGAACGIVGTPPKVPSWLMRSKI